MTLPPLTLIPAGAGSGKTHKIQETLGEWVAKEVVRPDRIMAVTFTEAAASELRERIGARLLQDGNVEAALALDQAYISTIHGFGLRILSEYAFEAGSAPSPRLLNEDEQGSLIRQALARSEAATAITADLKGFGYQYNHDTKATAEDAFRNELVRVIGLLRSLDFHHTLDEIIDHTTRLIAERYGVVADGTTLEETLSRCVKALLKKFPTSFADAFQGNKSASDSFYKDYRNLRSAMEKGRLSSDWPLWQSLRDLRQSKRGSALPEPYDEISSAVMEAASELPYHPGPLKKAQDHITYLLTAAHEVLDEYEAAKRDAGLVDYVDMIAQAGGLLRRRPDLLQAVAGSLDCLVIDEFQDTNPLQFDLLWRLKEAGVPTMIVGDLKQAIMGFQGADPRLLEAIENRHRDVADPLTSNWRTQAGLMGFINAIGAGLFGERYIPLTPQRKESRKTSLERIVFATKPRSGAQTIRAQAVGHRIRELLNDSSLTFPDRHTNKARPLRGSDIAVMCPTNRMLASYAETLRAMGIMVRLPAEGWFSTRPVQILWHALSFVANTDDKHAALYMAVTELGSLTLQEGLTQLMDQGSVHDPVLDRLTEVASHGQERSLYAQVTDTIHALGLLDLVATWPEGEQDRANLLRFPAEAAEYVDANREALASGGYYGSVLPSFLAWLSAKSETADKQPDARVIDEEAIELTTWHSSKGREWPVVFVCGLDKEIIGKPPSLSLSYDSFEELSALLDRAQITYSPKFDVPESTERFAEVLQAEATEEARRVLYVALTRARERLILEWPTYLLEKDSRSQFSLLVESCGISEDGDSLNVGDKRFDCVTINGGSELPASSGASSAPKNLPLYGRRAITPNAATVSLTPENRTPSSHTIDPEPWEQGEITIEKYGPGIDLQIGLERTDLGSYLHRCFEVLPSQPDALGALEAETGVTLSKSEARDVSNAVASFEQWIQERFSPHAIQRELPILAIDMDGVVVSGIVDYLVFTTTGVWIVDHKSNRTDDRVGSMSTYRGQLETYAHALKQAGHTVCGIAINWIRFGEFTILSGNQI